MDGRYGSTVAQPLGGKKVTMAGKKKEKSAAANAGGYAEQDGPRILVGDWWPKGIPDALDIADVAINSGGIRDMRRAVAAWATWAILNAEFPPDAGGFELARFLHRAFLREWGGQHAEDGDTKWLRQLFREAVDAADHQAREYLLLGAFEHMFEDLDIRAFFREWAQRGPAVAKFYAEACEYADGFIAIAERQRRGRGG